MRVKMRAGGAPWRPSLKVARLEDDTGTSLDPLPRAPVVSDWQRRDGGGATRVGRCGEGDSGSQRPNSDAPSADEMTASSRRTRWRHRREPATRGCGAHVKFVAQGVPSDKESSALLCFCSLLPFCAFARLEERRPRRPGVVGPLAKRSSPPTDPRFCAFAPTSAARARFSTLGRGLGVHLV